MKKIIYKNFSKKREKIPQKAGLFIFYSSEQALFVKSTENLQKFIHFYCDEDNEDDSVHELVTQFEYIEYKENDILIENFIEEILFIREHNPPFNKIFKPWQKYIYLGINLDKLPYLKVSENTIEDFLFLGPFRSSFAVNDILDVFADLFKMPRCPTEFDFLCEEDFNKEKNKCERLLDSQCLGFCQNRLGEALPEMLNRMMMLPSKEIITKLNIEHEALLNDLEFNKADELLTQINLLKKYYKHVLFFYTSQFIEGEFQICDYKVFIKDGMIDFIENKAQRYDFGERDSMLDLRKNNEILAYDKSEFDHRWIVFSFLYDTQPNYLEQLFLENVIYLQKKVFGYENIEGDDDEHDTEDL